MSDSIIFTALCQSHLLCVKGNRDGAVERMILDSPQIYGLIHRADSGFRMGLLEREREKTTRPGALFRDFHVQKLLERDEDPFPVEKTRRGKG